MEIEHGRLLIIQDSKVEHDTLVHHVEQLGYVVVTAENGQQALDMLQVQPVDVVLLDLLVSKKDKHQTLERLKADSTTRRIPVIVMATVDEMQDVARCIEMGATDYLIKPLDPVLLNARLDVTLKARQLRDHEQAHLMEVEKLTQDLKNVILPLGVALSAEKNFDQLLERIFVEAKSVCNADAGTLYLRTRDDRLRFAIMRTDSLNIAMGGTSGKEIPFPPLRLYDQTTGEPNEHITAAYVALHGHSINIPDIYNTQDFDFSAARDFDTQNNYRSTSILNIPLKDHDDKVIGVLQLINAQDSTSGQVIPFDSYQQLVVESLASQAAIALNSQLLQRHQQRLLKFEHDLEIGQDIQIAFLPDANEIPQPDGWEIVSRFHAARQVAGDFYDAFLLTRGKVGLVIADVCDKGVGAAIFMALSRSLIRAFAEQHRPLSWVDTLTSEQPAAKGQSRRKRKLLSAGTSALCAVELTNDYIGNYHGDMNMFATLFFGVLDPRTGVLTYVNGGHDPPAIIGPDGALKTRLMPTGPAVGMMPDMDFEVQQVTLEPGDLLMSFSDGVPDARNPAGERFTLEHLWSLLAQPAPSVAALLDRVETSLYDHIADAEQFDDITMLAVRRAAVSEAS